ncbi:hypothetical protein C8P68_10457 [Mucilaginibacter yixingensis]|uniref:Uncharacterized protein n=1 Tax=Mucilaginibacter yixingensis TaxID=1295612 RepID=A0A2T5J919_9SPHI|nr:hypothetical protein [Mucilaginibacter yixingensis]PTQ96572.1 hypothetical protein C8P68_10457 [Mucilaginibacter yixingensis]
MSTLANTAKPWHNYQKLGFRLLFIYFILQAVPLDWKFYAHFFHIDWTHLHFYDIFYISRYTPQPTQAYNPGNWGLATLADLGVVAAIALIGAIIWTARDKNSQEYNNLYYWLRVILRYRLAIALIAYGFIKYFPVQSPEPSLSNLNTAYGDFNRWKLFSLTLGITPGYQAFLGGVEIVAGLLLLFRRTTLFGVIIVLLFTGNVFFANLAYDGGEAVYALTLLLIASFLTLFDAQRIYNLVGLRKPTEPNRLKPVFEGQWRTGRVALKSVFVFFFVIFYGWKTYAAYQGYQYPQAKGLAGAVGLYDVKQFSVNHQELPYSATDTARWQDVVFEKWNTISIRTPKALQVDSLNTQEFSADDKNRDYELQGSAGRTYYSYTVDEVHQQLLLQNRNPAYANDKLVLDYQRPDDATIVLNGISHGKDSIQVTLARLPKKYLLEATSEGRGKVTKL